MIAKICGKLMDRNQNCLTVDVQGLCYEIFCPSTVLERLKEATTPDGMVKLVTYHYLQVEPSRSTPVLIGFLNE